MRINQSKCSFGEVPHPYNEIPEPHDTQMKRAKINTATERADAETKIADLKEELNKATRAHTELNEKYKAVVKEVDTKPSNGTLHLKKGDEPCLHGRRLSPWGEGC